MDEIRKKIKTATADNVKKSILDQLHANGTDIPVMVALVSDYVAMFRLCEKLKKDIDADGTMIQTNQGLKANPAIKELRDTSKSMLGILKHLGISSETIQTSEEDDL